MGASLVYLEEPNKSIEWASGEDTRVTFACGEMQGWRLNMVSLLTLNSDGGDGGARATENRLAGLDDEKIGELY